MPKAKMMSALYEIINPYNNKTLKESKALLKFDLNDDIVTIDLIFLGDDVDLNKQLNLSIVKLFKIKFGVKGVKLKQEKPIVVVKNFNELYPKVKVIGIMSGKGGVGKSRLTVDLAKFLNDKGLKVGIMDADIYGYSIPKIMNLYDEPNVIDKRIQPLVSNNIKVISAQYFIEKNENKAII